MSDVTHILAVIEAGDPQAAAELLPLAYYELRKLAAVRLSEERPGQTPQPTAIVHEAYLRLEEEDGKLVPRSVRFDDAGGRPAQPPGTRRRNPRLR